MKNRRDKRENTAEDSFTIVETLLALGILLTVMLEVVGAQGNIAAFTNYSRRVTEASWLAKRILSQVEYHWSNKEFKELETSLKDQKFEIEGSDRSDFDYTYDLKIEDWKVCFNILTQGGFNSGEEEDSQAQDSMMTAGLEQVLDQIFEKEYCKIAYVEVFWPEGARRDSVSLALLLTNERALDTFLLTKAAVHSKLITEVKNEIKGIDSTPPKTGKPPEKTPPQPPGEEVE